MAGMKKDVQPLARSQARLTAVTSSTNSTASGIAGPGRTVDMWMSTAGRGLERLLIRAVDRLSGPPNVFVARMMLIQAGKPSCPCKEGDSGNKSYPALDPSSVLRILMQYSSYRCDFCLRSYPDILIQHKLFLQDCSRLTDCIRSTNPIHQLLAVQHVLAIVALDTKLRSVFLMLGLIDILTIVQRQYSDIEKPGKSTSSDLFDMCDYAIDVFSGVEELDLKVLLERFKDSLQVDVPITGNRNITPLLLSKNIPPSISFYQQCFTLRGRLMRIRGFDQFFNIASRYQSSGLSDPVSQLWDLFSLGTPLCFIYNLLNPAVGNITINTDPEEFDYQSDRAKKRAIALFAMRLRGMDNCEPFTVTDLCDRDSTDGLVKVVKTVTAIVDQLPESVFKPISMSSPDASGAADPNKPRTGQSRNDEEFGWNIVVEEFIESERKYVSDLELMQKYSDAFYQSNTLVRDTLHQLFANLKNLVNFQRRFLIRLEDIAESPWHDQRWGLSLIELEDEFRVYEPYCANYTSATRLMSIYEQDILAHSKLIDAKTELPILRVKPIQRICNYLLFFELLIKASSPSEYPHFDELKEGLEAAKRIAAKVNGALRKAENAVIAQNLKVRVDDWKGYHMANFGELLLSDFFVVNKSEVDREYQIFLFQKIFLAFKEIDGTPAGGKRAGKKTQPTPNKSNPRLLMKARIFVSNITKTAYSSSLRPYGLEVWWREDNLECFTIRCRNEEQMKQWGDQINWLVEEASRRNLKQNNRPLPSPSDLGSAKQASTASLPHWQLHLSPPRDTPLSRNTQDIANIFSLYYSDEHSEEEIDNEGGGRNAPGRPRSTSLTTSLSSNTSLSTNEEYGSSSTSMLTTVEPSPLSSPPIPSLPPPNAMKAVHFNTPTDAQPSSPSPPLVKARVRFKEDLFAILVPRDIEFGELVEKIVKKIQLCGLHEQKDGPWRLRYVDEDGDRILMASTEDIRMAFENCPGTRSHVDLIVTCWA